MTSKWRQKCSPLQIIEPLMEKTWGQGCVKFCERKNKERNGKTPLRTRKYFEWIIKQLLNLAFVGYEEFYRSWRASVDNTLLDLQNSLYPTQPHSQPCSQGLSSLPPLETLGTRLPHSIIPNILLSTARRWVQVAPKTSKNITWYLFSRGPVRQVCFLLTNQLAGFPTPSAFRFDIPSWTPVFD